MTTHIGAVIDGFFLFSDHVAGERWMVGDVRVLRFTEHAEGDDEIGAGEGEIDEGGKQREGTGKNEQKREACKSEHGEGQEHAGEVGAFGERPLAARCRH